MTKLRFIIVFSVITPTRLQLQLFDQNGLKYKSRNLPLPKDLPCLVLPQDSLSKLNKKHFFQIQ